MNLLNKGIDKEIIDDYFNNNTFDEVEKIVPLLQKKKFSNELDTDQKDKIKAYCARKGFKISDIEKATKML